MGPIRKALRSAMTLALILTFCLPLGGAMLGVGLGFGLAPVWAVGIALMVAGFYGCPIAWVGYGSKRSLYRLVQAVEEENIYTVRELASQLGLSEKEVRNRIDTCFNKRYLVGYKREADGLVLNENRALREREHAAVCPSCGAKFDYKAGEQARCPYCGTLAERKN
ncbi:MAG TPA: hypothetical protein H9731_04575 [Candidatus Borkfalkia excrementipullorum]|nr:hypothetical protein [Candidatus Borkfalkia excrementipullorum]